MNVIRLTKYDRNALEKVININIFFKDFYNFNATYIDGIRKLT